MDKYRSVGNVFGKRKLFQRRQPIDAERFCEIYTISGECFLEGAEVVAEVQPENLDRKLYSVNFIDYVPPRCKIGESFSVLFDELTGKLYAVADEGGFFRLMLDNKPVRICTSNFVSIKRRKLAGRTKMELAESYREEEII